MAFQALTSNFCYESMGHPPEADASQHWLEAVFFQLKFGRY